MAAGEEDNGEEDDRPWARTFDLIAAEYGWTDQQILELPMSRIRQIEDVIRSRRDRDLKMQVGLEEAKLRILVGSIYAANGSKAANRAADSVKLIDWPEDQQRLPSTENAFRMFPPGAEGLYTPEQIAAAAEKYRG